MCYGFITLSPDYSRQAGTVFVGVGLSCGSVCLWVRLQSKMVRFISNKDRNVPERHLHRPTTYWTLKGQMSSSKTRK